MGGGWPAFGKWGEGRTDQLVAQNLSIPGFLGEGNCRELFAGFARGNDDQVRGPNALGNFRTGFSRVGLKLNFNVSGEVGAGQLL